MTVLSLWFALFFDITVIYGSSTGKELGLSPRRRGRRGAATWEDGEAGVVAGYGRRWFRSHFFSYFSLFSLCFSFFPFFITFLQTAGFFHFFPFFFLF